MLPSIGRAFLPLMILSLFATQAAGPRPVQTAQAGSTFLVNSTADLPDGNVSDNLCLALNGKCTLRAAIMQANHTSGMDTILLPAGTYTLTIPGADDADQVGDLDISDDVVINGAGPDRTIVDGNSMVTHDRVFQILSPAHHVTLSGMTLRKGDTVFIDPGQAAGFGGGLYQDGGNLTLTDMVIEGNQADYGGGLAPSFIHRPGTTTLESVTIRANQAQFGGGIYLIDGINDSPALFKMSRSTLSGNTAQYGGGLFFQGFCCEPGAENTTLDLINSTFSGNTVDHDGGGIYDRGGLVQLANVTVANNQVNWPAADNGGIGGGGLLITSTAGFAATLNAKNSLIGNNSRHKQGVLFTFQDDCNGAVTSYGNNLFASTTNCQINDVAGDLKNVDPLLGVLGNYGGSTQTQPLLIGGPAIDAGNPAGCIDFDATVISTDQRGFARPGNGRCDIGAYEYYPVAAYMPLIFR